MIFLRADMPWRLQVREISMLCMSSRSSKQISELWHQLKNWSILPYTILKKPWRNDEEGRERGEGGSLSVPNPYLPFLHRHLPSRSTLPLLNLCAIGGPNCLFVELIWKSSHRPHCPALPPFILHFRFLLHDLTSFFLSFCRDRVVNTPSPLPAFSLHSRSTVEYEMRSMFDMAEASRVNKFQ